MGRGRIGALAFAALISCRGEIIEGSSNETPTPPAPRTPAPLPDFAPSEARLHRLTVRHYTNSVRDLLGNVVVPQDLEVDTPLHGFTTVGASNLTIGPRAAEQYDAAAQDLAAQVFADPARREALVGCVPTGVDDPCIRTFVESFGRRAFRRPLASDEVDRWLGVVTDVEQRLGDLDLALEMMVSGILQAPRFLFRVDVGAVDGDVRRYDGYEIAARMSYFIVGSTPDDALLDAAERGELDTAEGIEVQARRLLDDPRARPQLIEFFAEHLKLDRLDSMTKDPAVFPQMSPTLGDAMRRELLLMIDDIAFERDADLREMFDARTTFVNAELARLYQLPDRIDGAEFQKVSFPENSPRAGVLTSGAFLALNAHATITSPTLRGRFVRQSLLCQDVPPPPPGVNTTVPGDDPNTGPETLRQRLERLHLAAPQCAGCHQAMDPIGFGLEGFDAIGAYRTTDNGLAVDTTGALGGESFRDARGLATLLRDRVEVAACISRLTYRYATGHLETPGESRAIAALADEFASSGYSFRELVVHVVKSDGFRLAAKGEE